MGKCTFKSCKCEKISENYYFLKISSGNGLRVENNPRTNLSGATYTSSEFSDYQTYEEDIQNLLDKYWLLDHFLRLTTTAF